MTEDRPNYDTTRRACAECRRNNQHGPITALSDYGDEFEPRCWIHAIHDTPIWQRQEPEDTE